MISTVVLNWGRLDLLRRCVESYRATVSVPHELVIVDNASTWESAELLADLAAPHVLLEENRGGEALNLGLDRASGQFLHVSENDLEYLAGWDTEMLAKFKAFPELGQLSLFGPAPPNPEAVLCEPQPCNRREANGFAIRVTETNITTSCLFRREIWDRGFRWGSYTREQSTLPFPADGRASHEIRGQGFVIAWNDRYVVRDWGRDIREIRARPDYYLANYRAKQWIGERGFRQRLAARGWSL